MKNLSRLSSDENEIKFELLIKHTTSQRSFQTTHGPEKDKYLLAVE